MNLNGNVAANTKVRNVCFRVRALLIIITALTLQKWKGREAGKMQTDGLRADA